MGRTFERSLESIKFGECVKFVVWMRLVRSVMKKAGRGERESSVGRFLCFGADTINLIGGLESEKLAIESRQ